MRPHSVSPMATLLSVSCWLTAAIATADDRAPEFEKHRLTEEYFAEGAGYGDFNHDGQRDLVSGPFWWAGPDFETHDRFYDGQSFPNDRGYSDNFFSYVGDFSGDGWDDVLVIGLPGTPAYWYENSQGEELWAKHLAFPAVDNEAPTFADLTGDGEPELVFHYEGRLGYAAPHPQFPERPWEFQPISEPGPWQRFTHGLGAGDVNGDSRPDFLMPTGWWEHPGDPAAQPVWRHHPFRFCQGGAQIYTSDVDGDGDADVITSLQAHAWGLSWFEQTSADDRGVTFVEHKIMGESPDENPHGVAFSQLHAVDLADMDGDGLKDIVTGKCYWAHNGADPGARDPAVVYWFQLVRDEEGARFVPHLIDDDSGVGRQVQAVDMNGDGLTDVIAANKKGTFLFLQSP